MKYADTFLSQELTQALGWTLLHSLWQGALVALALSVVLVFLNRHSAQVRYFISGYSTFYHARTGRFHVFQPLPRTGKSYCSSTSKQHFFRAKP